MNIYIREADCFGIAFREGRKTNMAVGTIVVTATKIISAASTCVELFKAIKTIKEQLINIRDVQIPQIWKRQNNVDSDMFSKRMEELDQDVQKMLDCLDEYEQVLRKSAKDYETTQQNALTGASNLKSPTNY